MIRALLHQWGDRFHRFMDYREADTRRIAVERDIDLARIEADAENPPTGEVGHVSELRRGVTGLHVEVMRGDGGRGR